MIEAASTISVIICAYTEERWNDLVAAVESLQLQHCPPCEIIVVIDHNPSLLERAQKHIPGIIVLENKAQRGLSGARNSGVAIAQGTYIAFFDDDVIAEPDCLAWLQQYCADAQVSGVGGKAEPLWSEQQPAWFPEEFYWVIGCSYRGLPETRAAVRNPFGCCCCFRREVFEVIGGFRHEIGRVGKHPLGCEETELCIRAKQHWPQHSFIYEPRARIQHRIPAYRTSWHYFCSRCYAEGLSKAMIAQYVGAQDALASERRYVRRTLPQGIVRGLRDALIHHDGTGLGRAGAIAVGLITTMAGYVVGNAALQLAKLRSVIIDKKELPRDAETPPSIMFGTRDENEYVYDEPVLVQARGSK
jgi:glucosyl-dolichyl phosphate glucuronosyltransferase